MRHISRRFPNGVTVWVEKFQRGLITYTAEKGGKKLGLYFVYKRRGMSRGELGGKWFDKFYGWLRAAREVS